MAQSEYREKARNGSRNKLVVLGYLSDKDKMEAEGWSLAHSKEHPVMQAYGRVYYWRWE